MLYLVATPIGNLSDITFRAIETLKAVDYVLCEDTRHSLSLLKHYDIQKPLKSFHKFNESFKEDGVIEDLLSGKTIALISDAGTPGISDPGSQLVQQCVSQNIPVVAIPGACAAITAISCSGLSTDRFQFYGFLPKKAGELREVLQDLLMYPGTSICYESPHRLLDVLEMLIELAPERSLVVGRELTKKFEEMQRGTATELLALWKDRTVLGEIVLLIAGQTKKMTTDWSALTPDEHVALLQNDYNLSKNDAIKMAAELRGVPKRTIYNAVHQKDKDESCD